MNRILLATLGACCLLGACGKGGSSTTSAGSTSASSAGGAGTTSASSTGGASSVSASSTGGTGTGGGGTGTGGGAGTGGTGGAACVLAQSGPIVVSQDGQVIENVHVVSTSGTAIEVQGHKNVVIRNARIEHAGGPGIDVSGSDDVTIQDVSIEHTGAPASGANPSAELLNIACNGSARLTVTRARLTRGSSGVYLVQCPNSTLSFLEGHDFRGPFPRGQLVQWNNSDGGLLEDFSVHNPATCWTEDNVNVYQSTGIQIRRGLIDGNNSPSGVGVIFDGGNGLGVVEDVDAVHMGNGCFSDYAGADGAVFTRTRCRDNICGDQGRGLPGSNALMWCGHPGYTQIKLQMSAYFAACNPGNIVWPTQTFAVADVAQQDFTLRAPIALKLCWE